MRFTSSSDTFWALSLSRSISTKSWGWFTVKLLNRPTSRGSALPSSARFRTAPCRARRPAPLRSWTWSLKPPVVPRPSIAGAPNTAIRPPRMSRYCCAQFGGDRGGTPLRVSLALFKGLQDHEHAAHVADVGAQQRGIAGQVDRVPDARDLLRRRGRSRSSAGRSCRCGPGWRRRATGR